MRALIRCFLPLALHLPLHSCLPLYLALLILLRLPSHLQKKWHERLAILEKGSQQHLSRPKKFQIAFPIKLHSQPSMGNLIFFFLNIYMSKSRIEPRLSLGSTKVNIESQALNANHYTNQYKYRLDWLSFGSFFECKIIVSCRFGCKSFFPRFDNIFDWSVL